jgi:hypothetical protein
MKKILMVVTLLLALGACTSDADVVSHNLSKAADQFQVQRRIIFYNGITGDYIMTLEGLCSLGNHDPVRELSVTCKTGPNEYKKHFLGLSDNVTYFAEQLEGKNVSKYHYKVVFKPETIVPDVDVR